jgi:GNAT superfamily N-acetyltransferase
MLRIRLAHLADLPHLAQIERETAAMFPDSVLPARLAKPVARAEMARGVAQSLLWVAERAPDQLEGFVLCRRRRRCLHICEMDVRPRCGRQGIGRGLLLHALFAARRLDVQYVTLTTFSNLPWNAPFYARHGFAPVNDFRTFGHLVRILRRERQHGLDHRIAMVRRARAPAGERSLR